MKFISKKQRNNIMNENLFFAYLQDPQCFFTDKKIQGPHHCMLWKWWLGNLQMTAGNELEELEDKPKEKSEEQKDLEDGEVSEPEQVGVFGVQSLFHVVYRFKGCLFLRKKFLLSWFLEKICFK